MSYSDDDHEIPDKYALRAKFHARAAEREWAKLQKLYGISDAQAALPAGDELQDWVATLNAGMESELHGRYWREPRHDAMENSGIAEDDVATIESLNGAARDILQRYIEAFHLRRVIARQPARMIPAAERRYVRDMDPAKALMDILINHRSNQAEAELTATGITPEEAHRLHTKLIGIACSACARGNELKAYADVMPALGSIDNPDPHTRPRSIAQRMDELKSYGSNQRKLLKLHRQDFDDGFFR